MNEGGVGELASDVAVLLQDGGDGLGVGGSEGEEFEESGVEAVEELLNSSCVAAEEPGGFGDDWPAGEQRTRHLLQSFYADPMILVTAAQDGGDRAGIDQDPSHLFLPNPLKCRRLVLRSFGALCAAPMIPASFARS